MMRKHVRHVFWLLALLCLLSSRVLAASVTFTITASEPVTVTGTPRIAINVGGVTRYANFVSANGSAMTFAYQVQAGDFDSDGISIDAPQIDLNGGAITDLAGNPLAALTFARPDTSGLKVQTYTAGFLTSPITNLNANAMSVAINNAPLNAAFSYTITSDGGAGSVSGSGTITSSSHAVSGVNVGNLPAGTLTLTVTVSNASGTGAPRSATAAPGFTGILDGRAVPEIAVSLYRLRSGYSGPLIRVRRSSDNAEQNIFAGTVAGGLDTAALSAFCGSASCYIRTWFDQSGNGRDAGNATVSRQPRIVNAGAIERLNGLPAPYFKGNALVTTNLLPSVSSVWSTHLAKAVSSGETGRGRVWGLDVNPSFAIGPEGWDDYFGSSGSNNISSFITTNPRIVSLAIPATGSANLWVNGSLASTNSGVLFAGGQAVVIGNIGVLLRAYDGYLHTVILGTGSYPAPDRVAIERWLGTLSGISVP